MADTAPASAAKTSLPVVLLWLVLAIGAIAAALWLTRDVTAVALLFGHWLLFLPMVVVLLAARQLVRTAAAAAAASLRAQPAHPAPARPSLAAGTASGATWEAGQQCSRHPRRSCLRRHRSGHP